MSTSLSRCSSVLSSLISDVIELMQPRAKAMTVGLLVRLRKTATQIHHVENDIDDRCVRINILHTMVPRENYIFWLACDRSETPTTARDIAVNVSPKRRAPTARSREETLLYVTPSLPARDLTRSDRGEQKIG